MKRRTRYWLTNLEPTRRKPFAITTDCSNRCALLPRWQQWYDEQLMRGDENWDHEYAKAYCDERTLWYVRKCSPDAVDVAANHAALVWFGQDTNKPYICVRRALNRGISYARNEYEKQGRLSKHMTLCARTVETTAQAQMSASAQLRRVDELIPQTLDKHAELKALARLLAMNTPPKHCAKILHRNLGTIYRQIETLRTMRERARNREWYHGPNAYTLGQSSLVQHKLTQPTIPAITPSAGAPCAALPDRKLGVYWDDGRLVYYDRLDTDRLRSSKVARRFWYKEQHAKRLRARVIRLAETPLERPHSRMY